VPELVGDAGYAQEPGLLSPAKEGAQTQWAVLTGGIDHDADMIPSPRIAAKRREPEREPGREPATLLAPCGASHRGRCVRCSLRAWASPACDHEGRWRSWRRRHHGAA
jgi:hypothetical protein